MSPNSKYFYTGSPFIPLYDVPSITDKIMKDIDSDIMITPAICFALHDMMKFHIQTNIAPDPSRIIENFGTVPLDLIFLEMGYCYPFETLLTTQVYIATGSKDEAIKNMFQESPIRGIQLYVANIKDNLDITRDLLKGNVTGLSVINFLLEKPFMRNDYFLTGLEFSAYVYEEVGISVAERIGPG